MAKNIVFVVAAATIVSFSLFSSAYGQEETMCRGVPLNMTVEQKGKITDCLTENKIKSVWKIPAEKLSCFGVCILKKKNLLTPDGKLDHDKIFNYIEAVMKPDEVKKPIKEGVDACIKKYGVNIQVTDDPQCTAFLELGQCVHDIFFDNCFED